MGVDHQLTMAKPAINQPLRDESDIMRCWQIQGEPLVSICCATYNHAIYIETAIKSFLAQNTSFPFEIIIRDDASTDGTGDIVRAYAEKYPAIIRTIINTENRYKQGERAVQLWPALARGEYIALCEGDDFWLQDDKLQLQVQALQRHPEVDLAFHKSATLLNGQFRNSVFHYEARIYDLEEHVLADFHFMETNTLMVRRQALDERFVSFLRNASVGDFFLRFYAGRKGAICLTEQMGCYRVNSTGSWTQRMTERSNQEKFYRGYLHDLARLNEMMENEHSGLLLGYKLKLMRAIAASQLGVFSKVSIILNNCHGLKRWQILRLIGESISRNYMTRYLKSILGKIMNMIPARMQGLVQSLRSSGSIRAGKRSYIHPSVHLLGKKHIRLGSNSCISEGSWLNVNDRRNNNIGIDIGNHCFIGKHNFFTSGKTIEIGDFTMTTWGCKFLGSAHVVSNPEIPYLCSGATTMDSIKIGVNCFIGAGATIQGNVKVGHGSVIGANAVVLNDIPLFSMVVGNPAKVIRRYSFERKCWLPVSEMTIEIESLMPSEQEYLLSLKQNYGEIPMPWIAAGKNMGDL